MWYDQGKYYTCLFCTVHLSALSGYFRQASTLFQFLWVQYDIMANRLNSQANLNLHSSLVSPSSGIAAGFGNLDEGQAVLGPFLSLAKSTSSHLLALVSGPTGLVWGKHTEEAENVLSGCCVCHLALDIGHVQLWTPSHGYLGNSMTSSFHPLMGSSVIRDFLSSF